MCRHLLAQIDHLAAPTTKLDEWITELLRAAERGRDLENLDSIPGIAARAAQVILAETSGDMTHFATPDTSPPGSGCARG